MLKAAQKYMQLKSFLIFIAIAIILSVALLLMIQNQSTKLDIYTNQAEESISDLYFLSANNKQAVTKFYFEDQFDDETKAILYEIESNPTITEEEIDEYRTYIYNKYKDTYKLMEEFGIRQFHIHLPSAKSFLRFHQPDFHGDDLFDVRETIYECGQTMKPVKAFEEGKYSNGYRYVYPIIYGEFLVGTVEYSIKMKQIVQPIEKTHQVKSLFIIKKDYVDERTAIDPLNVYNKESFLNYGYVDLEFNDADVRQALIISEEDFNRLNDLVVEEIKEPNINEYHMKYILVDNRLIWVYPLSVKDINGNEVGIIMNYKEDPALFELSTIRRTSQITIFGLFLIMLLLVSIALFLWNKYQTLASYDGLTKLYNRYYTRGLLNQYSGEGVVFMIDIDDFKKINDTYGHIKGDMILEEIGKLFKSCVRTSDYAVRWGGEEFMLLLKDFEIEKGIYKADNLCKKVEEHDFEDVAVTISIGVCKVNDNINEAIKCADDALLKAKRNGKNRAVLAEEINR